jgi:hypothetical protein
MRLKSAAETAPFMHAPQAGQKFSSPPTSLPHCGQAEIFGSDRAAPQEAQNRASFKFSLPQDEQINFSIPAFN